MLQWPGNNLLQWKPVNSLWTRLILPLLLMMNPSPLPAGYYDTDLLTIFAKILPRVVTMSSLNPGENAPISVCIVHEDIDTPAAESFEALLVHSHMKRGNHPPLRSVRTDFSTLSACAQSQLIFFFEAQPDTVAKALDTAGHFRAIIAAYDTALLDRGADVGLYVGRSVMPYINIRSLQDKHITLDTLLLRVSKIYEQSGDR